MEEKFCPGCPNKCPEDALSCGKGRAYFGRESGGHGERREHGGHAFIKSNDEVVNLLLKIGHTLHHSHAGGEIKLNCLTAEERALMTELLKKCLNEFGN